MSERIRLSIRVLCATASVWLAPSLSSALQDEVDPLLLLSGERFEGQVTSISQVAQLGILRKGTLVQVRLIDLRFPQAEDPLHASGQALMESLLQLETVSVRLRTPAPDSGDLVRGEVFLKERDVRLDLVRKGLAAYCPSRGADQRLTDEQERAKKQQVGIWLRYKTIESACSELPA